ncbi:MAG: hypothetical protein IK093_08255, partial [Ruminiclostridium sp.]|nr:hypothetical protein [Ruminiclostridium sp.]
MSSVFQRFARSFVTNLKTIIQAVIFSVIIWVFISVQIFPDITMHISDIKVLCEPTSFMSDENLRISSVDTKELTVQISGKRYSISQLTADDFTAKCDLSGIYEAGRHTVPIYVEANENVNCDIKS